MENNKVDSLSFYNNFLKDKTWGELPEDIKYLLLDNLIVLETVEKRGLVKGDIIRVGFKNLDYVTIRMAFNDQGLYFFDKEKFSYDSLF